MNDRALGERITSAYEASAPQREPAGLLDQVLLTTGHARQRPRWLALIKEPPMRLSSAVAVGSPTARMAAIVLATLLLAVLGAGAVFTGSAILAASAPLVVAEDGSGTHTTVIDAVADAEDGDTVLIKPGTYRGTVVIDKDITLRGDGPREEVILEFGSDSPSVSSSEHIPYGVMIVDSSAVVRDLMVRGPNVASAFVVVGGDPTIDHVANELEGDFSGSPQTSVALVHGASPTIRDSVLDGPIWEIGDPTVRGYEDVQGTQQPRITGNRTDIGIWVTVADGAVVSGNTITGDGGGIAIDQLGDGDIPSGDGGIEVAGNTTSSIFIGTDGTGITLRDNVVRGGDENGVGIAFGPGSPLVEGNTISGMDIGIEVPEGATPTIRSNRITFNTTGISVKAEGGAPLIEGNSFCGNETDLAVPEGSTFALDASNEVCAG